MPNFSWKDFTKNGDGTTTDSSYGLTNQDGSGQGHFYRSMNCAPHYTDKNGRGYTILCSMGGSDGSSNLNRYGKISGYIRNFIYGEFEG